MLTKSEVQELNRLRDEIFAEQLRWKREALARLIELERKEATSERESV